MYHLLLGKTLMRIDLILLFLHVEVKTIFQRDKTH